MQSSYRYDSLYRLTEAKETANNQQTWIQQFSYDRYGNRIGFNQNIAGIANGQITQTPQVDPQTNRFTSSNYSYDFNGNIVTDLSDASQVRNFTFNGDNKQAEIKDANGGVIGRYFYDGEGKRVKKVTNLETTIFVYDGLGKLVAEYSTDISPSPQIKYLTEDHLGTPRIITDATGQITARRDFLPFGEDLFAGVGARSSAQKYGATADDIRQKFTGYQKDKETSLDFAEARMYENRFGRFTAVDPLLASGKSANPQSFNRYVYVGNNPIIRIDPSGKDWVVSKAVNNGSQTYIDAYGKELKDLLKSGGYERVKFDGDYQDVIREGNGTEAGTYRMYAKGKGEWTQNFSEEANKQKQANKKADEGGMNDTAVAFGKGFDKNYETNMWLLQKMVEMDIAIISGLGTGLGGSQLTSIGNPAPNAGRFANWFYRGAENDLAWSQLSKTDKFFYELGQKTMTGENFARYANLDPVTRGRAIWEAQGLRSLISEGSGWTLGARSTFSTGPTPIVRYLTMHPVARSTAVFGATQVIPNERSTSFTNILGPEPANYNQGISFLRRR